MAVDDGDKASRVRPVTDVDEAVATDGDSVWPLTRDLATSFRPTREVFDRSFARALADEGTLLLVARSPAGGVVGYLLAHSHTTLFADAPVAWVEEVMVEETVRGTGVGRALVTRAETWAGGRGAAYVALATRRAGDFYRALGYEDSAVFFRKLL